MIKLLRKWRGPDFRPRHYYLAGVVVLAASLIAAQRPDALPPTPKAGTLRLITANLLYSNTRSTNIAKRIIESHSDLVVLLECSTRNFDPVPYIRAGYRLLLHEPRRGTHGVCVLARSGGRYQTGIALPPVRNRCRMPMATLLMQKGGQRIGVLGVHAPPPIEACGERATERTLVALARMIKEGKSTKTVGTIPAGVPIIVTGDLNAFPWSAGLSALARSGLVDSYGAHRLVFGPTWPATGPLPAFARIDYILTPEAIKVIGVWSITTPGSDHRAVIADMLR